MLYTKFEFKDIPIGTSFVYDNIITDGKSEIKVKMIGIKESDSEYKIYDSLPTLYDEPMTYEIISLEKLMQITFDVIVIDKSEYLKYANWNYRQWMPNTRY